MSNGYPSQMRPNYLSFIQNIHDCLIEAGYEVDILSLNSNFKSPLEKFLQYIKYYLKVLRFKKYSDYDLIYIHFFPYCFLPLIPHFYKMKNVAIHWHGIDLYTYSVFSKILNTLSYQFIGNSFLHFTPSVYFSNELSKILKINIEKIIVSPSGGIDTNVFNEKSGRIEPSETIRLGFASALLKSKGADLIVQLLENIHTLERYFNRKVEVHIIEYGKEKQKYLKLLSKFPNVIRHSPYPIKRMNEYYHQIDVLLFPSITKGESLGLIALEAMACNIPVIATDSFAFKETVILGVSGERFKINDFISFQNAIITCIENKGNYTLRKFVLEKYSKNFVVEQYRSLFNPFDKNS